MKLCALCGEPIADNPADPKDAETDEHAPALQFFPKAIRSQLRGSLWKVPSHKRCNEHVKLDEEYFLHYFYPLVAAQNDAMGKMLLAELKRRLRKPQSRGLIRRLLKESTRESPGGILLPPGLVRVNYDIVRIQNVALKVAKCLFYKDQGAYMPASSCVHFELCENVPDLQPLFADLWRVRELERRSAAPNVFRYWYIDLDGNHHYAMLFWEAFMICVIFQNSVSAGETSDSHSLAVSP